MARFAYYDRLTRDQRRTYRRSDAMGAVELPDAQALRPLASNVETALAGGDRRATERACQALANGITRQLGVVPVRVRVHAARPRDAEGELHGLYTSDGDDVLVEVWMRTAAHRKVVSFRTFSRTLLHELCHHLDLTCFGLEDTFHTEGFFRRESSLMRQLAPRSTASTEKGPRPNARGGRAGRARADEQRSSDRQLLLFR